MHFILSVRRGYHDIPYHNWNHALFVVHTIYAIIKHSKDMFTEQEVWTRLCVSNVCKMTCNMAVTHNEVCTDITKWNCLENGYVKIY